MSNRETTRIGFRVVLAGLLCLGISLPAWAQLGEALNAAQKLIKIEKEKKKDSSDDAKKASEKPAATSSGGRS